MINHQEIKCYEEIKYCVHCGWFIDENEPYFIYVDKDKNGKTVYACLECV